MNSRLRHWRHAQSLEAPPLYDAEFERHIAELNSTQMNVRRQRTSMQQQPVQQQQSKTEPEDKT